MDFIDAILLIGVGALAGCINTIAGGGSLMTLPLLIFMGIPSSEANATNRLGIFLQNIFAVRGFKSKGVAVFPFAYWVAISASLGSLIGSMIAVDISDGLFNRILALIMIGVVLLTVLKPGLNAEKQVENFSRKSTVKSIVLFFFIGIYGGFIQAGVGFLIIATLSLVHSISMAKVNSIKVFAALSYTTIAIVVFIYHDMIYWEYGLVLAIGTSAGGWFASRWSVTLPDKYIRVFLLVVVSVSAVKLWFF